MQILLSPVNVVNLVAIPSRVEGRLWGLNVEGRVRGLNVEGRGLVVAGL